MSDDEDDGASVLVETSYPVGRKLDDLGCDLRQIMMFVDVVSQQHGRGAPNGGVDLGDDKPGVLVLNNVDVRNVDNMVVIGNNNCLRGRRLLVLGDHNVVFGPDNRARGIGNKLLGERTDAIDEQTLSTSSSEVCLWSGSMSESGSSSSGTALSRRSSTSGSSSNSSSGRRSRRTSAVSVDLDQSAGLETDETSSTLSTIVRRDSIARRWLELAGVVIRDAAPTGSEDTSLDPMCSSE
jgi:hypothetical protein